MKTKAQEGSTYVLQYPFSYSWAAQPAPKNYRTGLFQGSESGSDYSAAFIGK
jgi:hypothetical protein